MIERVSCLPGVVGVHRDGGVAQHRLDTRGGDDELAAAALQRVRKLLHRTKLHRLRVARHTQVRDAVQLRVLHLRGAGRKASKPV